MAAFHPPVLLFCRPLLSTELTANLYKSSRSIWWKSNGQPAPGDGATEKMGINIDPNKKCRKAEMADGCKFPKSKGHAANWRRVCSLAKNQTVHANFDMKAIEKKHNIAGRFTTILLKNRGCNYLKTYVWPGYKIKPWKTHSAVKP